MIQVAIGQVAVQAGYFGFLASMPLALARSGLPDAQIGLIVGLVAVVQIPAALAAGALVDQFGPIRLIAVGAAAFLIGAGVLLLPGVDPTVGLAPFVIARVAQGVGFGLIRPAWLSLLPRMLPARRSGIGLGIAMSVQNLSLTVMPPLTLVVLGASASLDGVAIVVAALVVAGSASLILCRGHVDVEQDGRGLPAAPRRCGIAYRSAWTPSLVIMLLYILHWGVISAYLPQRAELAGANVGLFFLMDGLLSLFLRFPAGWLADRINGKWLALSGLALTAIAIALLLTPVTTPTLMLAGALTGAGSGLIALPIYVELTHLSSSADRGSAFAMLSTVAATALVLGSIGAAPIVAAGGFEAAILAAMVGLIVAMVVTTGDKNLARKSQAPPEALGIPAP